MSRDQAAPGFAPEHDIVLHGPEAFAGMRAAGRLAAATLDFIAPYVIPGVEHPTGLMRCANSSCAMGGAIPACLGYRGFPKATCISANHVVCHGIPGEKRLEEGDIVNIDITVILDGWYGDTSLACTWSATKSRSRRGALSTLPISRLCSASRRSNPAPRSAMSGTPSNPMSSASVFPWVRDFCGHGLGRVSSTARRRCCITASQNAVMVLQPGMFFTIEPMVNTGHYDVKILSDGWTAVTRDRSLSAQFEHSIGVTETGVEIFTLSPAGHTKPLYPDTAA